MLSIEIDSQKEIMAGFRALSDTIRISVLELLRTGELCVCEISEVLDISQSKLSFHLKTLKDANLVNSRQQGKWTYYSLNLSQLVILERYLAEFRRNTVLLPTRLCN